MAQNREVLESLEWLVAFSEELNRGVAEATEDPIVAHAGVVLVLTFLAGSAAVDRERLTWFLESLDVEATWVLDGLAERGLVESAEGEGTTMVALTPAGYELYEAIAGAMGASMARSEDLARMRARHLSR